VPRVEYEELSDDRLGEPSAAIRGWVEGAHFKVETTTPPGSPPCSIALLRIVVGKTVLTDRVKNGNIGKQTPITHGGP
jgi:hypothetical protein